jgi:hypothetical protein
VICSGVHPCVQVLHGASRSTRTSVIHVAAAVVR